MRNISDIGVVALGPFNRGNGLFDKAVWPLGENLEYPYVLLREALDKKNIEMNTLDMRHLDAFDIILCFDVPSPKGLPGNASLEQLAAMGKGLYLVLSENEMRLPENWDISNHRYFNKIFTWNDAMVDGKKYIKYFIPNKIPKDIVMGRRDERKLCTLIASNMYSKHPQELYSERVRAIRWFENNRPNDFDLYGRGWNSKIVLAELHSLSKRSRENADSNIYSSYNGQITSKREILSKYKFSICYENARDFPGYISEKIFDCFFAGTIPVYLGAPNVTDFIPNDTFIDKRKYLTYESLYEYIFKMPQKEYEGYLHNIKKYVLGKRIRQFSAKYFVDTIIRNIITDGTEGVGGLR